VALCARAARDLRIRHVANQHVQERVLRIALHGGAPLAPDEVLALKCMQLIFEGSVGRTVQRPEPECLSDHRGPLEQRLLVRREHVEPRRDDALEGFRKRFGRAALREHACELLRVEWIAARSS
jgi:hypothetical protein